MRLWWVNKGPRLRVTERPVADDGGHAVEVTDVPDRTDNGVPSTVVGLGATANEAARHAFQHAADLMFPRTG